MSVAQLKIDATLKPNNKRKKGELVFVFEMRSDFTNNAATEGENANYKNTSGGDCAPRANVSQIVL